MTLAFPKGVVVKNPRLSIFYYSLVISVLVGLIARIYFTDQFFRELPVGQHIQIAMWPTGAFSSNPNLAAVVAENNQKDFCQDPASLTYQWDDAGDWMYENYACLDLCGDPSSDRADCLDAKETYLKEGQSQILLVTEIEDTWLKGSAADEEVSTKFRFVPTTEALGIQFTYSLSVPEDSGGSQGGSTINGGSPEDVLTVILDHKHEVWSVLEPSSYVGLTLDELFELAGDPGHLDKSNPRAGPNELPGLDDATRRAGPSYRISGSEIVLDTKCYNRHMRDIGEDPETGEDWRSVWKIGENHEGRPRQAICYITVEFKDSQWVSAERVHISENGRMLHRYHHGVRISFQLGGTFHFLDPNFVFAAVVDALVLLRIPKQVVLLFMISCLGSLSKIYSRVFYEPLNIMDQVGALAVRLMAQSAQFVELEDRGDGAGDGVAGGQNVERGISRKRMEERLRQTLKLQRDRIDASELTELVNVCFEAVTKRHQIVTQRDQTGILGDFVTQKSGVLRKDLHDLIGKEDEFGAMAKDTISLENFVVSCSSNEVVEVDTIVELFDLDRKMSKTESFFMPLEVRRRVQDRRHSAIMIPASIISRGSDAPFRDLSMIAKSTDYAGAVSLTLEQRKAMSFKNELKIRELMSWKENEASEKIKLLEIRVSKLAADFAAKLADIVVERQAQLPTAPLLSDSRASSVPDSMCSDFAELAGRVAQLEASSGSQDGGHARRQEFVLECEVIEETEGKAPESQDSPWSCCRPV